MDINRITNPLRLAKGSHQPGSGKGCAMNVISYINGDEQITDFPVCSARPLACLVQSCNDLLAGPDGYLSPENSVLALELGWQTMGTAAVPNTVIHAWVAELLTNPDWGVVRYAKLTAMKAIIDIAELHRRLAAGDMAPITAWDAADRPGHTRGRTVCATGRLRVDRTRGYPRRGGAGGGGRQRAAHSRVGDRGHHGKPCHAAHPSCRRHLA
jgi:hypothetical protein